MLKLNKKLNKLSAMTGAAFTLGMIGSSDAEAAATGGFNDVAGNIVGGINGLPGLLTALSYMMGLLFSVLGVLKIKDHVENPTQTQLKDGAIRLAVGGSLFAIPVVTSAMQELVSGSSATSAINAAKVNKVVFETN